MISLCCRGVNKFAVTDSNTTELVITQCFSFAGSLGYFCSPSMRLYLYPVSFAR